MLNFILNLFLMSDTTAGNISDNRHEIKIPKKIASSDCIKILLYSSLSGVHDSV